MAKVKEKIVEAVEEVEAGLINRVMASLRASMKIAWDELLDIYLISHIMELQKSVARGGKMDAKEKREQSDEKMLGSGGRIFHAFTHDDDIKWSRLFAAVRELYSQDVEERFMKFLEKVIALGYDEDTLRIRLIGSFQKKEKGDAAIETVKAIVDLDRKHKQQINFAIRRKLLVKKSLKNFLLLVRRHKIATLLWAAVIILLIIRIFVAIFG